MANLKKPIGELIPVGQQLLTASVSDSMAYVASRMLNKRSERHLSQIPLKTETGKVWYVITGNDLARWAVDGRQDVVAGEYGADPHWAKKEALLEEIIDTVANFGYVLVIDEEEDDHLLGILSYTDVIRELTQ